MLTEGTLIIDGVEHASISVISKAPREAEERIVAGIISADRSIIDGAITAVHLVLDGREIEITGATDSTLSYRLV